MYCPSCRGEFREGFTRCEDCDEDLVEKLPEKAVKPGYVQLATVFTEGEIAAIKANLDQAGIDYYFHGEQAHRLAALPLEARLMVREDFKEEAEALLSNLDES
ncbi:MAG: putative signal transducing protein [Desulfobulbales bacterium]